MNYHLLWRGALFNGTRNAEITIRTGTLRYEWYRRVEILPLRMAIVTMDGKSAKIIAIENGK